MWSWLSTVAAVYLLPDLSAGKLTKTASEKLPILLAATAAAAAFAVSSAPHEYGHVLRSLFSFALLLSSAIRLLAVLSLTHSLSLFLFIIHVSLLRVRGCALSLSLFLLFLSFFLPFLSLFPLLFRCAPSLSHFPSPSLFARYPSWSFCVSLSL